MDERNSLKLSDVIEYIEHTTEEERGNIVRNFLTDMNTLAQSAINLFEKNKIALTLFDVGFEFKVVDYAENTEIISIKHGFPANSVTLTEYMLNLLKGENNGLEESGSSDNEG